MLTKCVQDPVQVVVEPNVWKVGTGYHGMNGNTLKLGQGYANDPTTIRFWKKKKEQAGLTLHWPVLSSKPYQAEHRRPRNLKCFVNHIIGILDLTEFG